MMSQAMSQADSDTTENFAASQDTIVDGAHAALSGLAESQGTPNTPPRPSTQSMEEDFSDDLLASIPLPGAAVPPAPAPDAPPARRSRPRRGSAAPPRARAPSRPRRLQ